MTTFSNILSEALARLKAACDGEEHLDLNQGDRIVAKTDLDLVLNTLDELLNRVQELGTENRRLYFPDEARDRAKLVDKMEHEAALWEDRARVAEIKVEKLKEACARMSDRMHSNIDMGKGAVDFTIVKGVYASRTFDEDCVFLRESLYG